MSTETSGSDLLERDIGHLIHISENIESKLAKRNNKLSWQVDKLRDHVPQLNTFQNKVKLDVGGQYFCTTIDVLTRSESIFSSMFSGGYEANQDPRDGSYYVDRNPRYFDCILEFMRTGGIRAMKKLDKVEKEELKQDAEYYVYPALLQFLGDKFVHWEPKFERLEGNITAVEEDQGYMINYASGTNCSMFDTPFPENARTTLEVTFIEASGCYGFISFLGNDDKPPRGSTNNGLFIYMGTNSGNGLFRGTQPLSGSYNPSSTGNALTGPDGSAGQVFRFIVDTSERTMNWWTGETDRGSTPLPAGEFLWLNVGMWCCSRFSYRLKWSFE
jgi:hypothetical protein